MHSRIAYFITAILLLCISGFMVFAAIMANSRVPSQAYMVIAITIMTFCISYLYPQFKQNDERVKMIRQKGMFVAFVAFVFYFVALSVALQYNIVVLSAIEVLYILFGLKISTVFLSWVVLSKIY